MATLGIIYTADVLLQNINKIVCLRLLIFDIFNYKPYKLRVVILQNQGSFPLALSLKRSE